MLKLFMSCLIWFPDMTLGEKNLAPYIRKRKEDYENVREGKGSGY